MMYQIGVCDDEPFQIKVNSFFLKEIADKNGYQFIYHGFQTGQQLKDYLSNSHLDLLFLDIDLGDESGIEIASWITQYQKDIVVIFVTGHREFAEEAFEVEASGYLVKPYDIQKMEKVLKKAIRILEPFQEKQKISNITIVDENIKKKIDCQDIQFIERKKGISVIKTVQREYKVYESITSLCERLGDCFVRVNQGEVVHRNMICDLNRDTVFLKDGKEISIGRTYRKDVFKKYFGE